MAVDVRGEPPERLADLRAPLDQGGRRQRHHDDGNSLNNQRGNLFWRTGQEQMFTRRRLAAQIPAPAELEAIPF
jgi:hypothetical protein